MITQDFIEKLKELDACKPAMDWVNQYDNLTPQQLWHVCLKHDWMLWLLGTLSGPPGSESRKKLACCVADIADLVLPVWEAEYPDDDRPRRTIEAARRGDPEECKKAARAADAAASGVSGVENKSIWAAYAAVGAATVATSFTGITAGEAVLTASRETDYWITKAKIIVTIRRHYPTVPML